jgi:hypothetical protein
MKLRKTITVVCLAAALTVCMLIGAFTGSGKAETTGGYVKNPVANALASDITPMGWFEDLFGIPVVVSVYGTLHAGSYDTAVANGSYTNKAFGYTAPDGFSQHKMKTPAASDFQTTVLGTRSLWSSSNTNGWYYFKGYNPDHNGDTSLESGICLDTVKPQAQILIDGETAASGGYTKGSAAISVLGSDDRSGVESYWYKLNNGSFVQCYASSTFTADGVYSFYVRDRAGNVSDTVTTTKDSTVPTIAAYSGSSQVANGAYTNAATVRFEAADALSGVSAIYIIRPDSATILGIKLYTSYTSFPVTLSTLEGEYKYYSKDKAGNNSATYSFKVDKTLPAASLTAGGSTVASGSYTRAAYVAFTASDASGVRCYVKRGIAGYEAYTSGTQITTEGVYTFYAIDNAGNRTADYKVTMDRTAPAGTLYAGNTVIQSGAITNASYVTYSATDNVELAAVYVMKPNTSSYVTFTAGTQLTQEGTYRFYAVDTTGNASATVSVTLDKTKPTVTVYDGNGTVPSGAYTKNGCVSFTASDAVSGLVGLYVRLPESNSYISYVSGTPLYREGTYYFYASDKAGNISETASVILDTSVPYGVLTANGGMESGGYTNVAFRYTAADAVSGVAYCEVKRPNGSWEGYTSGTEILADADEGWYTFRAFDRAGNVSQESKICLLVTIPDVWVFVNETPVSNGTYTNRERVAFAPDDTAAHCYVKLPDAFGFIPYTAYYTYTAAGRYEFYAEDNAGNRTDIYVVVIDRTSKTATVNGAANGNTMDNVTVTWTDGDENAAAPIVSVTVNGRAYNRGNLIRTINGGTYAVGVTDAAGNVWTTEFIAVRKDILSDTLNYEYWETKSGAGETYAFKSYGNAFGFAVAREAALVRTGVWNNTEWDGGIQIDALDLINAKNGTYYIYKESGDKNIEVAYFTTERLNAVIAEYAAESIKAYYYFQKSPATVFTGNDLYSLRNGNEYIGTGVTLGSHANYLIDGAVFDGLVYDTAGVHTLIVYDDYGNRYEYVLKLVAARAEIFYKVGNGGFNLALSDKQYRLKNAVTIKITDGTDGWAMYIIRNADGDVVRILAIGEEYTITASGRYYIQSVNHGGYSDEVCIIVSLNAPGAAFVENAASKRLDITVTPSADMNAGLTEIAIYKSVDGGTTWTKLTADDYGRVINKDRLSYSFKTDGLYRAVLEDDFRNGIEAVKAEKAYTQPAPAGTLSGVNDGGYTNGGVRFVWTDEATVTLTKDGDAIFYVSGRELIEDGKYELTIADDNGYSKTYAFVIDTLAPEAELSGAVNNGITNGEVAVVWADADITAELYKDGELAGAYESGAAIDADGVYKIMLTDKAGNTTEYSFEIVAPPAGDTPASVGNEAALVIILVLLVGAVAAYILWKRGVFKKKKTVKPETDKPKAEPTPDSADDGEGEEDFDGESDGFGGSESDAE